MLIGVQANAIDSEYTILVPARRDFTIKNCGTNFIKVFFNPVAKNENYLSGPHRFLDVSN
jgi:hypothetical protein